ncbi:Planctomycete cytochrome C [Neorhodopirellula lusitana]|uniref:Planctomycete cytochrome C n=1 Tax=Neorhodopirellula lusitana TaxID=445327 RepID=A0ABY1QMA0_9BACT|nr:PSD1 and planctomycete cytochrome C domain-containing protein [Neorhodopirellula lusitana]SMP74833.1 Planctomycete cytochrome C [Neorhodopirellula lusitana]
MRLKTHFPIWLLSCIAIGLATCSDLMAEESTLATPEPLPEIVDFNEHIRPIFNQHCTACHGGVKQAADISFVYKDQVLPPEGWIVEPGSPEDSILIQRILEDDPDLVMPPAGHGAALPKRDIALLTRWIEQGAIWTASHWSLAAPKPQTVPEVSDSQWPSQPLDHFVLAKLHDAELKPSPPASGQRWLRRTSLDLIGLPPTLTEQEDFITQYKQDPQAARVAAVDRLLESPAYGERWGSVWLDQVRYADSKGLGLDSRRSVWKYRDWVIDSFNQDLPYDEFTIKQLAGDLLPNPSIEDLVATTAHRLTQSNEEGGTDDEEFRVEAVLDRVNTTWQVWLGTTFGCVQCHSHPYDPFRHEEYYQFTAFFNNTSDVDLDEDWPVANVPLDPTQYNEASQLDRQIQSLKDQIWQAEYKLLGDAKAWQPVESLSAKTNNQTKVGVQRVDNHDEFHTIDTVSRNTDITLEASLPESLTELTAIRLTILPLDPETAISDSEWGFVLSQIDAELTNPKLANSDESESTKLDIQQVLIDEPDPFFDPQLSLDKKSNRGFAAYSRINRPRQAALVLAKPQTVAAQARLKITLKHRVYLLAAFSLISKRGHLAVTDDSRFTDSLTDEKLTTLRERLRHLENQRSKIKSVATPVMKELPEHLRRPTHLFERGLFLTKGEEVCADTPESLPPLILESENHDENGAPIATDRLALAKWLVRPDNPLTARVAVNRVWAQLFGVGLVATEEDFGSSGDLPSHPRLLDYLALRFQNEMGWSMKSLLRELVLSSTYAQSSKSIPESHQQDPRNRLLSRGPRYRLTSEMVRDQALVAAGLLSEHHLGKPVYPPIPGGVWKPFHSGDKWNSTKPGNEQRYRRSIYTYTKRSIPYPMFATFDAPSREFCTPRRLRSNTPLQALMMLNDETFVECANALANQMKQASDDPREQIRNGFLRVLCREPSSGELDDLIELLETPAMESTPEETAVSKATPAERKTETQPNTSNQPLRVIATVLLNLDEAIMK